MGDEADPGTGADILSCVKYAVSLEGGWLTVTIFCSSLTGCPSRKEVLLSSESEFEFESSLYSTKALRTLFVCDELSRCF